MTRPWRGWRDEVNAVGGSLRHPVFTDRA